MLTPTTPSQHRTHARRRGFTLVELLVVIGIIILMLALAVPLLRVLSGNRSQTAAANQIAGLLGEARAKALGLQQPVGVLFFKDPTTDRYAAAIVNEDPVSENPDILYLDIFTDTDTIVMQPGVGIQFLNGPDPNAPADVTDRYIGFGLVLFDSRGELITQQYAIRQDSGLGKALGVGGFRVGNSHPTPIGPAYPALNRPVYSQFGLVLFDYPAFTAAGGTDGDWQIDNVSKTGELGAEEAWLDQNCLPFIINRYSGTLMKAE